MSTAEIELDRLSVLEEKLLGARGARAIGRLPIWENLRHILKPVAPNSHTNERRRQADRPDDPQVVHHDAVDLLAEFPGFFDGDSLGSLVEFLLAPDLTARGRLQPSGTAGLVPDTVERGGRGRGGHEGGSRVEERCVVPVQRPNPDLPVAR